MPRSVSWHCLASVLVVGASLFAADMAAAAPGSRACRQIEAQLANPAGSGKAGKYSAAIERQRGEIGKIRGQMRAAGCGFFSRSNSCAALSRSAARMERNLGTLQSTHSRLRGGGKSRAQLLAALDANDCRGRKSVVVASREPGLLERLFGGPERNSRSVIMPEYGDERPRYQTRTMFGGDGPSFDPGAYRTFCVRACDGYYFPMSPSSSRSDLTRDAQNCQTACPGADMQVYYHRGADEEAGLMMSVATGEAYADLPMAFAYKSDRPRDASCGCAMQASNFTIIAGNGGAEPKRSQLRPTLPPLPTGKPDPAADPETLANIDGDFGVTAIRKLLSKRNAAAISNRKVRVVGPVFLPDPPEAAGRQAPVPSQVQ